MIRQLCRQQGWAPTTKNIDALAMAFAEVRASMQRAS